MARPKASLLSARPGPLDIVIASELPKPLQSSHQSLQSHPLPGPSSRRFLVLRQLVQDIARRNGVGTKKQVQSGSWLAVTNPKSESLICSNLPIGPRRNSSLTYFKLGGKYLGCIPEIVSGLQREYWLPHPVWSRTSLKSTGWCGRGLARTSNTSIQVRKSFYSVLSPCASTEESSRARMVDEPIEH